MLDQLRRHASSWLVKATLTLIILTFIFFFGYARIASRYTKDQTLVAKVDGQGIPLRKFQEYFQTSLEQIRKNSKSTEEMPAQLDEILKQNILNQLIARELTVLYAEKLGLTVSEEELARAIRSQKELFPNGEFDLRVYEERFLPSYRQRYGEGFEKAVERDLGVEKIGSLVAVLSQPWQKELAASLEKINKDLSTTAPSELLSLWVDHFQESVKVETFVR